MPPKARKATTLRDAVRAEAQRAEKGREAQPAASRPADPQPSAVDRSSSVPSPQRGPGARKSPVFIDSRRGQADAGKAADADMSWTRPQKGPSQPSSPSSPFAAAQSRSPASPFAAARSTKQAARKPAPTSSPTAEDTDELPGESSWMKSRKVPNRSTSWTSPGDRQADARTGSTRSSPKKAGSGPSAGRTGMPRSATAVESPPSGDVMPASPAEANISKYDDRDMNRRSNVSRSSRSLTPKRTVLDNAPALGPKNTWADGRGGTTLMEATNWAKWTRQVDKGVLGAHYDYITGILNEPEAREDETTSHDKVLAANLQGSSSSATPRQGSAAFTDRAKRMNEGTGARDAMMGDGGSFTQKTHNASCFCPVCCPDVMRPAGMVSNLVRSQKESRCMSERASATPRRDDRRGESLGRTTDSLGGTRTSDVEQDFWRSMGRKVKPSDGTPGSGRFMPHREFTPDNTAIAGKFDQDATVEFSQRRSKQRQAWQHGPEEAQTLGRSGMALVMGHVDGDPTAPIQITSARKAAGECSDYISTEAEKFHTQGTPRAVQNFRFERQGSTRSRSVPPRFEGAAGIRRLDTADMTPRTPRENPITRDEAPALSLSSRGHHTFRSMDGNRSGAIGFSLHHEAQDYFHGRAREDRMNYDQDFAEKCSLTPRVYAENNESRRQMQASYRSSSAGLKDAFQWDA